ncbi:MAG: hypothetical protein GT600_08460 [Bacteroidales bacterium]|jgi:hypothetical protein|nr:hypothetical protein [Bacteroidales bacterium]NMD02790.1 hypothetical protein [Bacteroidales bacterium]OQB63748.1 MAG: hypothetical protein BWX96_01030 [Bacteroidetes bacterium ADurb.Bin145]HOU01362.1 hypothetical protein [Bacteroidales bacterium]HQK67445.1 hypothetical protein [Bacteroidales bacterium]
MIKTISTFILIILHPVHVSLTSIDHVPGTDSLKVFVRMYFDDFLIDYRLNYTYDSIVVNSSQTNRFPEELMSKYLNDKINISVNNKQLKGKLLNMVLTDNEISSNLLFKTDKNPKSITIRNQIMTDLYNDQANMTIVRVSDFEEGVKLTPEKREQLFILK